MALRKTIGLLPEIFRTDRNEKFLNATIDQLVTPALQKKINAYVGRKFAPSYSAGDQYVVEPSTTRQNYQLEPGIVYTHRQEVGGQATDRIEYLSNYVDMLNRVNVLGGNIDNHDRIFENEYYTWSSFFDFDKFVNFSQYYWLANGPDPVQVFNSIIDMEADYEVTRVDNESAYFINARNSVNNPTITLARGGTYNFEVGQQGFPFWIQTEPGLSGTKAIQDNISTRDILGVVNNGDDQGVVTFNVPTADAQNFWIGMTKVDDVDYATRLTYSEINNQQFSAFIAANPDGFDGITDIRNIDNATLVFYNEDANESEENWESGGLFDADETGFDNDAYPFDPTTYIPADERYDIYRINIDTNSERRDRFNNMPDSDVDLAYYGAFVDIENKVIDNTISIDGVTGSDLVGKTIVFVTPTTDDTLWIAEGAFDEGVGGYDTENFGMDGESYTAVATNERYNVWTITSKTVDGVDRFSLSSNTALIRVNEKVSITEGDDHIGKEFYKKDEYLFLVPTNFFPLNDGVIQLTYLKNIPQNQKILVARGEEFGNLEFWKNALDKLEKVPVITAPLTRYFYQDGIDSERFGIIDIVEAGEVPVLDVENDIIGQNEYISLNKVEFTNGMKVSFDTNNVVSEYYAGRDFYVEGVGQPDGISLTPVDELIVPETYVDTEEEGFDVNDFDTTGYAGSISAPLSPDYFTINRSSKDRNAWSRANRWVHIDVIEKTAEYNDFSSVLDQNSRANRPIIEFEPNLQLYKYGRVFKQVVTCFDSTQIDALSNVEGKAGYFVDGIPLLNGVTVIWAADEDPIVRSKIYEVSIIDPDDDGNEQIHMTEVADAEVNDTIIVTNGSTRQGTMLHYDGDGWVESQQKTQLNQEPYFDIFDTDGNSFSDDSIYFGTGFTGTKLFSYQRQSSAVEDSVLGFGLSYKNFENVGDIIFENNYVRDKFTYSPNDIIVKKPINDGFVHRIIDRNTVEIKNDWNKVNRNTRQYQIAEYSVTDDELQVFQSPIAPKSDELETVNLFVYKNSTLLKRDTTQNITNFVDTDYTTLSQDGNFYIILDEPAAVGDQITIRVYADDVGDFGFYEIPQNLENNAKNEDFTTLTLGQIRNHITQTSQNSSVFFGDSPGRSNLRDVTNLKDFAGTILQHSAGAHFGAFLLSDENINFKHNEKHVHNANAVISIDYAQREYSKFKQKFYDAISTLDLNFDDIPGCVDAVINELKIGKSETFPFFYSDMIGYGEDNTTTTYTITNPEIRTYDYGTYFDNSVPSNRSVLVYLNGTQLYLTTDYTFDQDGAIITFTDDTTLSIGDTLQIVDYNNTDGSFIPPTPTKMGMYPKFRPEIYTDNTFRTPQTVIQGHDGSIFVAFGDSRDQVILELEKRIYNNIKTTYTTDVFDIHNLVGGKFRTTDYTRAEIDDILSVNFLRWAVLNKVDYADQTGYDIQDKFTWNWSNFTDKVDGELLPGHWRGVYRYFYDTDRPHTHPWEMLGLSEKPLWWDDRYGAAPYTKGNEVLWENLRDGKLFQDAAGEDYTILENYKRPNLMSIIPVDVNGRLVDPLVSVVAAYNTTYTQEPYSFGDVGPAESAWRRSSEYPFALMRLAALTNPSKFLLTRFDTDNIIRNTTLDQIVNKTTLKRIKPQNMIIHGTLDDDGNVNRVNGISQIISDYARHRNVDLHNIQEVLEALVLKLVYRVGGYTDKRFLKVLAEQVSPTSTNKGIFIPDDDFEIELTKSNPITSVTLSGVIVTKTNSGWTVRGYDYEKPYFDIIPSEITQNRYTISGGDANGVVYRDFKNEVLRIPYNTEFTNPQQVVDFFVSYQRYLRLQGFVFDEVLEDEVGSLTKDWILSAKEFLFWQSQGWNVGSTIVLNPVAISVKFELFGTTPDDLGGEGLNYKVLNQNLKPIRYNQLEVKRVDNLFTVTSSEDAGPIFMIEINPVQYEHTIVFNNITVFNDVLYQPQLGSRQYRLKLIGTKTAGWDGSFQAPGYVFNNDVTATWQPGRDYKKGDFVIFRKKTYVCVKDQDALQVFDHEYWTHTDNIKLGLRPNLDTLSNSFTTFYDMDTQNNESEFDRFGKGLIGYQKRDYLENLELDDVSQVKFYQGMIRQKGTSSAINKLIRAQLDNQDSDINFFEEWAFRIGEYGAIDANQIIEVELNENQFKSNPELIEFLNNGEDRPQHISYIQDDLFKTPNEYTKNIFTNRSGGSNTKLDITSAGFPRLDDVSVTLFDINNISSLNQYINNVGSGYTIWTAKNLASVWDVFRVSETFVKVTEVVDKLDDEVVVRTDRNHDLEVNDFVAIRGTETILDGFYKVLYIVSNVEFIVSLEQNELSETDLDGLLLKLESIRYSEPKDIAGFNPLLGWQDAEKTWLENNADGKWEVLKKQSPWDFGTNVAYSAVAGDDNLGTCFSASERNLWAVAGIPNNGTGKVISYVKTVSNDFSENAIFDPSDVSQISGFGTSVSAGNSDYFAVGAPTANGTRGYVFIYKRTQASTFAVHQILRASDAAVGDLFGTSVSLSDDEKWLYVGAPGASKIYAYAFDEISSSNEAVVTEEGDGIKTSSTLFWFPETIDNIQVIDDDGRIYVPYVDYTLSGNVVNFTFTLNSLKDYVIRRVSLYRNIDTIVRDANPEDTAADNLGQTIETTSDGKVIVSGAPNRRYVGSDSTVVTGAGAAYVFERTEEVFNGDGTTTTFTPTGTLCPQRLLNVYLNNDLKLYTVNLALPGSDSQFGDYTISGNSIVFRDAPSSDELVKIEVNDFIQVQRLDAPDPADSDLFGNDITINEDANWIAVGAPGEDANNTNTGSVYVYAEQSRRYGTITGETDPTIVSGDKFRINDVVVSLTGTDLDTVLADIDGLSISGVSTSGDDSLTIDSESVITGNKLRVMPLSGDTYKNLGLEPYAMVQRIDHPQAYENENFGLAVDIDRSGNFLVVGSNRASTINTLRFDVDEDDIETTVFDSNSTKFYDRENQSGAVYVYDLLESWNESVTDPAQFGYIQQLQSDTIEQFDEFGSSVNIRSGKIVVGSPKYDKSSSIENSGILYEYNNPSEEKGWITLREEDDKVDVELLNKVFIYNRRKNEIVEYMDWIDPIKGKVSGLAQQELSYIVERDPANYNVNTNQKNTLTTQSHWGEKQVGQLWWDVSTVRYIDYEQGELSYRSQQWGAKFPGSSIDVYEWVESNNPPSSYSGEGTPKYIDNSSYVEVQTYNINTDTVTSKYYFWVKDLTEAPNLGFRKLGSSTVARIIDNPKTYGLKYLSVIKDNAIIAYNIAGDLEDRDTILHINYDVIKNSNVLHSEYQLVAEGDPQSIINDKIYNKFVDSLSGTNAQGDAVPQRTLSTAERYGVLYRPRQTMFVDKDTAVELFVTFCNEVFAKYQVANQFDLGTISSAEPIPGEQSGEWDESVNTYAELTYINALVFSTGYKVLVLQNETVENLWTIYTLQEDNTWILTRVQAYDTNNYWERTTWYADGFTENTVVTYAVETEPDLETIRSTLTNGDLVKIKSNDEGVASIVQLQDDGTFLEVVVENATIKLKRSLFDNSVEATGFDNAGFDNGLFEKRPVTEIRKIIDAVKNDIFVEDIRSEWNRLWFTMIEYILTEQPYADWLFKTSFIKVVQKLRGLDQYPNYQRDNQDYIRDYINEAKPYRTNIREYILQYTKDDPWDGDVTDFDVHSYYDTDRDYYRKPSGEKSGDAALWLQGLNSPWGNNYTYELGSVSIINSGSGYLIPPVITVVGGGGTGATVEAKTNGDRILSVTVTNPGSGYVTTPTFTIEGVGSGLEIYPNLINGKVREFDQTLKFDRITYSSTVIEWTANTSYDVNDIVSYNGEAYIVDTAFTSGSTFDAANMSIYADENFDNNADRIQAYYKPTEGMIGKDITQLQFGTDYPGVRVYGPDFSANPGFDVGAFDVDPYDSFEIDENGITIISGSSALDTIIRSNYTDAALGTAPEDINVAGGDFVDTYNSHAPEEFVPGIIFDTLDLKVYSLPGQDGAYDGNAARIYTNFVTADGSTAAYSYRGGSSVLEDVDRVFVWTTTGGALYEGTDFTINYTSGIVTFTTPPAADDLIYFYSYSTTGEKLVAEKSFTGDGTEDTFTFTIDSTIVQQAYVLVDGVESANPTTTLSSDTQVDITLSSAPADGAHVHIMLYNVDPAERVAYSAVTEQTETSDGSTRVITLDDTIRYAGPFGANIIVEVNGSRLRPPNVAYYQGDGDTTTFYAPTSAGETGASVANSDIFIGWIDYDDRTLVTPLTNKTAGTDYVVNPYDGSSVRSITFIGDDSSLATPSNKDTVIFGITTDAEYTVSSDGNTLTIDPSVSLSPGDTIRIIGFSNHDMQRIQTNVFVGTGDTTPGQRFTLDRSVTNSDYLWVTVDGTKLHSAVDYTVSGNTILIADTTVLTGSSVVVVSGISENIAQPSSGFRIFKDMLNDYNYYRIAVDNSTTLAQDLDFGDDTIYVTDASVLAEPNIASGVPGFVMIDKERITYWEKDDTANTLTRIRRGTSGTGAKVHNAGVNVIDVSGQKIPGDTHTKTWYTLGTNKATDGKGLQNSDTVPAKYLVEKRTLLDI